MRGLQRKVAFRDALRGWVPDEMLDGPKRGFELPLATWFRGELVGFARDVLLDSSATSRGCFEPAYVTTLLDRHAAGAEDHGGRIWALLLLELWQRQVLERPREQAVAAA